MLGASAFSFDEQHAWLIDSGASCHMIGEGMLDGGHVEILKECAVSVECSLASGEPIILRRRVSLRACFVTCEGGLVCATLTALVAPSCNHAILSTGQMAQRGWQVSISDVGVEVKLGRGDQEVALGTTVFGNVGWCYTIPTRHYRVQSKASSHDNTHDNTHEHRSFEASCGEDGLRGGLGCVGSRGRGEPTFQEPSPGCSEFRLPPDGCGEERSECWGLVDGDFAEDAKQQQQQFEPAGKAARSWDGAAGDTVPGPGDAVSGSGGLAWPAGASAGEARGGRRTGFSRELDGPRCRASGAKVEEAAAATGEAVPGEECDGGRGQPGESKGYGGDRDSGGRKPSKKHSQGGSQGEEDRGLGTPWASFAEAADESSVQLKPRLVDVNPPPPPPPRGSAGHWENKRRSRTPVRRKPAPKAARGCRRTRSSSSSQPGPARRTV